MRLFLLMLLFYLVVCFQCCIGSPDSIHIRPSTETKKQINLDGLKQLAVPSGLLSYGILSKTIPTIAKADGYMKDFIQYANPHRVGIDDYCQYAATTAFLSLDYLGVPAKHTRRDRLLTGLSSHLIMACVVNIMKKSICCPRPDGSATNSFPSGHTATAFVGADLVWQEYHEESVWYGLAAYGLAAGTGFLRMHNNKHWCSDVVMGAGIGILSSRLAYLIIPTPEQNNRHAGSGLLLLPNYSKGTAMLTLYWQL